MDEAAEKRVARSEADSPKVRARGGAGAVDVCSTVEAIAAQGATPCDSVSEAADSFRPSEATIEARAAAMYGGRTLLQQRRTDSIAATDFICIVYIYTGEAIYNYL